MIYSLWFPRLNDFKTKIDFHVQKLPTISKKLYLISETTDFDGGWLKGERLVDVLMC